MTTPDIEKINLNLDTTEREDPKEPFAVVVAERRIVMKDPADFDWQDLLKIENPTHFLTYCMEPEDLKHFNAQKIPGWKVKVLMESYQKHYGIASPPEGVGSRI